MKPKIVQSKFGGGSASVKCRKIVSFAEAKKADGLTWHRACFICADCSKSLDTSTVCLRDSEAYCKACYGKQFGPKGVGFGVGAGALQTA